MSLRLPILSGKQVCEALAKLGFSKIPGRGKGGHVFLYRQQPPKGIVVPNHKEVRRGTLRAILRQADISVEEFRQVL